MGAPQSAIRQIQLADERVKQSELSELRFVGVQACKCLQSLQAVRQHNSNSPNPGRCCCCCSSRALDATHESNKVTRMDAVVLLMILTGEA
jgi:hypothetical protein